MNGQSRVSALETGYELHWYRLERVLGQGAFGITYLAQDINLDRQVAIKEYLPDQFAVRNTDLTVSPATDEHREDFEWGLKRFISEARTLTRFEHPNLVRVFNVFEMNNTAYMVMNYEVGKNLHQVLKNRGTLSESEITKILMPLMSGLEVMHEKGFVHRDIKPANIFIRGDGSPVLLDFGSARQTRTAASRDGGGDESQTLTTLVSPGYAPIEQYGSKGDRQGPWTDIYGLGATLYRAVVGSMPVAAVDRGEAILHDVKDPYLKVSEACKDRYSENFLAAIDHAMAFRAEDRPRSIADWRRRFAIDEKQTQAAAEPTTRIETDEITTEKLEQSENATFKGVGTGTEKTEKIDSEAETVRPASATGPAGWRGLPRVLGAGAAAGIVLIGVIVFLVTGGEAPVTGAPAPEGQGRTSIPDPGETPGTGDAAARQRIDTLLAQAQEDIRALRLTSPGDNNAFDKYTAILRVDEDNAAALAGIRSISDKYLDLAYGAMESNELDRAETYLSKASAITPGSREIATAREALQAKRAGQDEGLWARLKQWQKENAGKAESTEQETSEDRVRKALGGQ